MNLMRGVLFLCLLSVGIQGCSSSVKTVEVEDALLWEVSGNGLQQSSYVLGTKHDVDPAFLVTIPGFRRIFKAVKQFAPECDMLSSEFSQLKRPKTNQRERYLLMPLDTTYNMLYDTKDFQLVDSVLKRYTSFYEKFIPLYWVRSYGNEIMTQGRGSQKGMDVHLTLVSYQNSKKIVPLESVEDISRREAMLWQLNRNVNLRMQAEQLLFLIKCREPLEGYAVLVDSLYRQHKLSVFSNKLLLKEMLNKMSVPDSIVFAALGSTYLKEYTYMIGIKRNKDWIGKIEKMIKKASTLIAVGGAHLLGKDGIIELLREQGYVVQPVVN